MDGRRGYVTRRKFLRWLAGGAAAACLGGAGYGRFEAGWLHVTHHAVAVPRLPPPFAGKRLALLTDPHHGPFNGLDLIRSAVDVIDALAPDLVALAGDFIQEGHGGSYVGPCLEALGRLRAPLGVFAVPGNHDHYQGVEAVRRAIRDNGIADVTNAGRWVETGGCRLRVGGVDDLWHGEQDLDAALGDATAADACLLLCHNPDYAETLTDRRVGLVLSGHLHGGQIVLPGLGYPYLPSQYGAKYVQGLVRAPATRVFVSRGLGTVGLPLRFRCRPEINVLTLVAA
jgi:predicted MPP superfamily phosphohydrolase